MRRETVLSVRFWSILQGEPESVIRGHNCEIQPTAEGCRIGGNSAFERMIVRRDTLVRTFTGSRLMADNVRGYKVAN